MSGHSEICFQMNAMITRRKFLLATAICAPYIARGQTVALNEAISGLPQLHSLQIQRGNEVIFAQAQQGAGLDR